MRSVRRTQPSICATRGCRSNVNGSFISSVILVQFRGGLQVACHRDQDGGGLSHATSPKKSDGHGCFKYSAYSRFASLMLVSAP